MKSVISKLSTACLFYIYFLPDAEESVRDEQPELLMQTNPIKGVLCGGFAFKCAACTY